MRPFTLNFLASILLFACSGNTSQTVSDKPRQKGKVSSTMLKIIPTVPSYIPIKSQQDSAKKILISLYGKAQIELTSTDNIEFIDQGENFDSVSCNLCGRTIKMEDWQNAMDNAAQHQFVDLTFVTPCCHKTTSLNDLTYHSAAGFAKFVITVSDLQDDLPDKVIKDLQEILGTPLRKIWAHY